MTKEQGKKAIEKLKEYNNLPNDFHGKIGVDGSFFDMRGNYIDNLNYYR